MTAANTNWIQALLVCATVMMVLSSCQVRGDFKQDALRASWQDLRDQGYVAFINGKFDESQRSYSQAIASLGASEANAQIRAAILADLGEAYQCGGKIEDSIKAYRSALQIAEGCYKEERGDKSAGTGALLVACQSGLAENYLKLGKADEAVNHYRAALRTAPIVFLSQATIQKLSSAYCELLDKLGRHNEAAQIDQPFGRNSESAPKSSMAPKPAWQEKREQALRAYRSGNFREADNLLKGAADDLKTARKSSSSGYEDGSDLITILSELSKTNQQLGNDMLAETYLKQALELARSELWTEHPATTDCIGRLADFLASKRKDSEAIALYQEEISLLKSQLDARENPDPTALTKALTGLSDLLIAQGKLSQSEPMLIECVKIEKKFGNQARAAGRLDRLAQVYSGQSKFALASKTLKEKLAVLIESFGPDHIEVSRTLCKWGTALGKNGQVDEAEKIIRKGLQMQQEQFGADDPQMLAGLCVLGDFYRTQGKVSQSRQVYLQALAISKRSQTAGSEELSQILEGLSDLLVQEGKIQEAGAIQEQALSTEKSLAHPDNNRVRVMLLRLRDINKRLQNEGRILEINRELQLAN